jgi:hypothetical protein
MPHAVVEWQGLAPGAACREGARARTPEQGELFACRLADQQPAPRLSGQGPRQRCALQLDLDGEHGDGGERVNDTLRWTSANYCSNKNSMRIEFDAAKREQARRERGLDMARADEIFAGATLTAADDRRD